MAIGRAQPCCPCPDRITLLGMPIGPEFTQIGCAHHIQHSQEGNQPECCNAQMHARCRCRAMASESHGSNRYYFKGYCRSARRFCAQAASSCPAARGLDSPQLIASI